MGNAPIVARRSPGFLLNLPVRIYITCFINSGCYADPFLPGTILKILSDFNILGNWKRFWITGTGYARQIIALQPFG